MSNSSPRVASFMLLAAASSNATPSVPSQAQIVIDQIHQAAKAKDFPGLEKLMVQKFLWSFGGDGDAKQAIAAWNTDPQTLQQRSRLGKQFYRLPNSSVNVITNVGHKNVPNQPH